VCGLSGCIYTPNLNFSGTDSFIYQACDPSGACDTATGSITITAINDNPIALADTGTTAEDTPISIVVLTNDSDADGNTLSVTSCGTASTGTVVQSGNECVYTPAIDYIGMATFTYDISDGNGGTASALVTIDVGGINDTPMANDDSVTTNEDTPVDLFVLANDTDPDGDTLSISGVVSGPSNG
jgi:hypothetical protein